MKWNKIEFGELYLIPSKNGLNRPSRVRGDGYKMINMGELFANDRIKNIPMELVPLNDREKETSTSGPPARPSRRQTTRGQAGRSPAP